MSPGGRADFDAGIQFAAFRDGGGSTPGRGARTRVWVSGPGSGFETIAARLERESFQDGPVRARLKFARRKVSNAPTGMAALASRSSAPSVPEKPARSKVPPPSTRSLESESRSLAPRHSVLPDKSVVAPVGALDAFIPRGNRAGLSGSVERGDSSPEHGKEAGRTAGVGSRTPSHFGGASQMRCRST